MDDAHTKIVHTVLGNDESDAAIDGSVTCSVAIALTNIGFPAHMADLRFRQEDCRVLQAALAKHAAAAVGLPPDVTLDMTNYDTALRLVWHKSCHDWTSEFGGQPWMSLKTQVAHFGALTLLLESDPDRRREMAAHFSPPDPLELVRGIYDTFMASPDGCLAARVGEVMCLQGDWKRALAYTSEEALAVYVNKGAHISAVRVRGVAHAALGEHAAAAACLEKSCADAAEAGFVMAQVLLVCHVWESNQSS